MTDPYLLLGVTPDTGDEGIRAAYLAALRACPPERDARRFEQIRAAFEAIGTQRARQEHALFSTEALAAADLLQLCANDWRPGLPSEERLLQVLGGSHA